jgi:hypothetical protein
MEMKKEISERVGEVLLTREQLADRWGCCKETVKRMQQNGELSAIIFSGKNIRYSLADIEQVERERRYCRHIMMEGGNNA